MVIVSELARLDNPPAAWGLPFGKALETIMLAQHSDPDDDDDADDR